MRTIFHDLGLAAFRFCSYHAIVLANPSSNFLTDIVDADLVHAHMVGAWWAVAQVIDDRMPFVATEHNQVNWAAVRIRALRPAAGRVDRFFAMGPAAHRFAEAAGVRAGVLTGARSAVAGLGGTPSSGLASRPTRCRARCYGTGRGAPPHWPGAGW